MNYVIYIVLFAALVYATWYYWKHAQGGSATGASLATFTEDLTAKAARGEIGAIIGREEEVARVVQILSRKTKNNPVLIGSAGVGKTAIVEGLALRIVTNNVPEPLRNKKILSLNLADMISGTKYRGEFEKRVRALVDEVIARKDEVILFIDEMHMLVQAKGTEGAINISDILKPALARGELHAIGATTTKEFDQYIKPDEPLARRFQPVEVAEPSVAMTVAILKGTRQSFEEFHKVEISDEAIEAAATLSQKYITERLLPDKALDLIDEAGAAESIKAYSQEDSALALVGHAAKAYRSSIDRGQTEVDDLKQQLQEWQFKKEKAVTTEATQNAQEHIIAITKEVEDLEHAYTQEKNEGKRPVVKAIHIKKIVANWKHVPIHEITY